MGGKKKTKWKKVSLAEFTKEIQNNDVAPSKINNQEGLAAGLPKEEEKETFLPLTEEVTDTGAPYTISYGEHMDGFWYPTSYITYNPELVVPGNYFMPIDSCYYYYTPEIPTVQEYVPAPYQDYSSAVKDTVYLLLPTPALRPPHTQPYIATSSWQNRRRRRRNEIYADYAVIPEKPAGRYEQDSSRKSVDVISRKPNCQSNNVERMTSFSETNSLNKGNSVSEAKVKRLPEPNDVNRLIPSSVNDENKDSKYSTHEERNISPPKSVQGKKKLNACGVHTKKQPENNFRDLKDKTAPAKTNTEFSVSEDPSEKIEISTGNTKKQEDTNSSTEVCSNNLNTHTVNNNIVDSQKKKNELEIQNINNKSTNHKNLGAFTVPAETHLPSNTTDFRNVELSSCVDAEDNHKRDSVALNSNASNLQPDRNSNNYVTDYNDNENSCRSYSQTSLPDILSTLNKSELQGTQSNNNANSPTNEKLRNSSCSEKINPENETNPKSKSILSQNNYVSHLLNSDTLNYEMEMELKKLTALESLQANQSIYKLAYDENVTDQSEVDSRSPSPIDPESQMPSSITNAEILIHEADSGSEAGSEDVELIPHRYESESSLHENKHVYVNKLSLAVELLRTEENLPYDDEFKRVVAENNQTAGKISHINQGEINLGFVDDYYSDILPEVHSQRDGQVPASKFKVDVVNESRQMEYPRSSVITTDNTFDDLICESCEVANEITFQRQNNQDQSEDVKTEFRRFGVRARHYLSPRAALVNPCFCCIIM